MRRGRFGHSGARTATATLLLFSRMNAESVWPIEMIDADSFALVHDPAARECQRPNPQNCHREVEAWSARLAVARWERPMNPGGSPVSGCFLRRPAPEQ